MSAHPRGWPIVAVLLAVAGCSGTHASTQKPHTDGVQASGPRRPSVLRQVTFDPSPWRTAFARHSVPLTSILPGGPPPDGR
jgi:hypothetical protein